MSLINQVEQGISLYIENVVATATLDCTLNLEKIIKKIPNIQYNPKKFPGGVFRLQSPKTVILFFRTGKIVCTGGTSVDMTKTSLEKFRNIMEKHVKKSITLSNFKIQNIVSSANFGKAVHLEQAARTLPRSLYEPEQFPGIIHRLHYPKTVILIFASGKLVCTGGKNMRDIHDSVHSFYSTLKEKNLLAEKE